MLLSKQRTPEAIEVLRWRARAFRGGFILEKTILGSVSREPECDVQLFPGIEGCMPGTRLVWPKDDPS
jgi:hypothetical protein